MPDLMGTPDLTPEEKAAAEEKAKLEAMTPEERAAAEKAASDKAAAEEKTWLDALKPEEKTRIEALSPEDRAKEYKAAKDKAAADDKAKGEKVSLTEIMTAAKMDQSIIDVFKPLDNTLTKDQAEKLMEAGKRMKESEAKAQEQYWVDQDEKWTTELKADKDFGGEHLEANGKRVQSLLNKMKTGPALREYLDSVRHGNNPQLFRFLAEVSSHFSEDFFVTGADHDKGKDVPAWKKMGYKEADEYK